MVEVELQSAPSRAQAEAEIRVHLLLWQILNPDAAVEPAAD